MEAYAVVTSELPSQAVEIFLHRAAAESFLEECLEDEPEWAGVLRVVPIELDERNLSPN